MVTLETIHRFYTVYAGGFFLSTGLFGTIMQLICFLNTSYYRKTPCTFYFLIATIHEFGLFAAAIAPLVVAGYLDIDMKRISPIWCKLRFFFASSFCVIPLSCISLATIDQFLITSQTIRLRQLSNIKNAHRVSTVVVILWWVHAIPWLIYLDKSTVTGACSFTSSVFLAYSAVFICLLVCIMHNIIIATFGILAYQNIRKTIYPMRLRIDRQLTVIVFMQVLLALIGICPYSIYALYILFTLGISRNIDQRARDAMLSNMSFLFRAVAFGGRFYLFTFVSPRFRRSMKEIIFWWKRGQRTAPIT